MEKNPVQKTTTKKRRFKTKTVLMAIVVLLIIGLGATSAYFFKQYRDLKNNPQEATEENVRATTDKVSKLINLPNETPTIAVVQDKESLKDQPFFKDAQNGDKVLIFSGSKQAILYRESENKLVNVGPVSLQDPNAQNPAEAAPAANPEASNPDSNNE